MANQYPFRPYPNPGVTTITGDPNNPFGGTITDQNMNMVSPDESPEQTIMRLARSGLGVDQISQMTGIPQDQVAMQVASMTGNREAFMPGGEFGQQEAPAGIGIESLVTDTNTPEISSFIDEGNSFTDLAASGLNIDLDPSNYLNEAQTVQTLETFGVDLDELDSETLDEEDDLLKKTVMASAAGATANGEDDEDAVNTLSTMSEIHASFDPNDPEAMKEQLEVYKKAAEIFYDTDDLKELVPQPDKSLPFMIAGAALIQAGERGDSWGTALSNAFLQYSLGARKEEKDYEDKIAGIELQEKQDIKTFAMQLYMADYKEQQALERALLTKEKKAYRVNNGASPTYYTSYEADLASRKGDSVVPWTAEDGGVKEYTIFTDADRDGQPDANAPARTQLLSEAGAINKQSEGYLIREGNLTKDKKLYMVDNVPTMYTTEELDAYMSGNPNSDVRVVGASSAKAVRNRATGELTFIDNRELLTPRGQEMYVPIGQENTIVFGPDGQPIMMTGDAAGMGTLMTGSQRGKEETRVREFLIESDKNRDNILTTHWTIKNLLANQEAEGKPVVFGVAGSLTTFGKNVIDQVDQLQTVFTDPESGYAFYNDENGNGKRDPGETSTDFSGFGQQFEDQVANTNLGRFLQGSGLGKKRLTNMVLTLALQSAANDDQKGRDISDKDIERFLTRAGAYATSQKEFITVIDDLALGAIRKHESLVDAETRYAARLKLDPETEEKMTMIDFLYPNLIEDQKNQKPFRDAPYNIGELKEQLINSTSGMGGINYTGRMTPPNVQEVAVLPGGGDPSGRGTDTIHDLWMDFKAADDGTRAKPDDEFSESQIKYLQRLRRQMDPTDLAKFQDYLNKQRGTP
jgi:hypothetical protein